ncbi:MAG: hypothetical protein O7B25_14440 [Gammaproteobacteria bacterium]|nr:hypothetical protein [Gammaproteobacteria bacterium]
MTKLFLALLISSGVTHANCATAPVNSSAAITVMHEFLAAFNARDEVAWAQTLHFPHVRVAGGEVIVYANEAEFVAAMDLDRFAETTNWNHSTWDEMNVIQASAGKVHITVIFSRFDSDGDKLSTYRSLYVVENIGGRWGVRMRSSFAP